MSRLVEQVTGYATLIDRHAELFAALYSALLGEEIRFDGPTERWIVWPAVEGRPEPREAELRNNGIRVVGYVVESTGYRFTVGQGAV